MNVKTCFYLPKIIFILTFLFFLTSKGNTQHSVIPFDSLHWDLSGAKLVEYSGRSCISGTAILKEMLIENGVVEVDMAVTGQRSYPGILFHYESQEDYERIYIRPHIPPSFQNVIQYVSTFNGIDSWQLYSGPGFTASAEIPKKEWFHIKIEIKGKQARLFLNNAETPALLVSQLGHGARNGQVGLTGPNDGTAYFSNFSCRIDNALIFPAETEPAMPYGVLTSWQLSQPFKLTEADNELTPEAQGLKNIVWKAVNCRPDGIVDISRYYPRKSNAPEVIYARTVIDAQRDEQKLFSFGYSDIISVFLNGKLIYCGNSSYTSRDPSFQGIVGLNDFLNLPLKQGRNELLIALVESFGGWGFIFQDAKALYLCKDLVQQWELKHTFKYPECVTYDPKRDICYVSNYFNDGKEFISRIKPNGEIVDLMWATGIMQPAGMWLSHDKLFVVCRFALVEIDPESGSVLNRYRFPDPGLPNDVTGDEKGNLYITDSRKDLIYRFTDGKLEVWLDDPAISKPNGILFHNGKIYVGNSGDGCIKVLDPENKTLSTLVCIGEGAIMDGLASDGMGGFLFSDYNNKIYRIRKDGRIQLLLHATTAGPYCAAFEYIPEKRLLVVPTLFDNRVIAYTFSEK